MNDTPLLLLILLMEHLLRSVSDFKYVLVKTNPWCLYMMVPMGSAQGWSVYKLDANQMDTLQLPCFILHGWIKSTLSMTVLQRRIILHFCLEWQLWCSWWKAIISVPLGQSRCAILTNVFLRTQTIYKHTFDDTQQLATDIIYMTHVLRVYE